MEKISQKERRHTSGSFSHKLPSYADDFSPTDSSFGRNNKTDDIKDEALNKSSYKWMYNKLLNYYAILVLGLFSLTFFNLASIEVFITGVVSGFSICIALIGHGIADLLKDEKNAILDLWETQDESTVKK